MKKVVIHISLIILTIFIYILQANFFNWFTISGIMPNLFVIYVLFIGLFSKKTMGATYGFIIGILLDLIIGTKVGLNAVGLALVGFLAALFDKNFSKDSRVTIMVMIMVATAIFEILIYILNYIILVTNLEIWNFIKILTIEVIYNLILTIILYPLMQKFGYYIENEYKGNTILTRYF